MHDEQRDMLNEPDKGVEDAQGVLARLFRQILLDINVNPYKWGAYMSRYLEDPRNGVPRNGKDRSSARGNLNKELRRPKMTWKVFRKALQFLGPVGIRFEVQLEWPNHKKTIHAVSLASSSTDTSNDEDGDDEG